MLGRQRPWRSHNQQQALIEYGLLKHACPEGIYLSLTPGNLSLWSGVLFVRKGPYSPAVLRFQVAFPQRYPEVPPLILFTSDVFHPLITPLTTYTYTTGSSSTDTVSATDEERLPPGGFSLRHGFSRWFDRGDGISPTTPIFHDSKTPSGEREGSRDLPNHGNMERRPPAPPQGTRPLHIPPPKDDGSSTGDTSPSIIEVLHYLKRVFEDEFLLDDLPLDAAGNPGAWHAWHAHRRRTRPAKVLAENVTNQAAPTHRGLNSPGRSKPSGDWNWDGVWVERVKRGISGSLSESMLYGGVDGDDLIHFLDLDDEAIETVKKNLLSPG